MMYSAFTAVVSGYVQGVGFRFHALRAAERRGISGFVRNLPTGEVEAVAEGPRDLLESLLDELRLGPRGALVRSVSVLWSDATGAYTHFDVR